MARNWGISWKNPFWLVFVIYFGLLSFTQSHLGWQLIWFWLGGLVGAMMNYVDRLVYVYYTHPEEPLSKAVQKWLEQRQWRLVMVAFQHRGQEQKHLALHSLLFLGVWIIVAFYLLTSSGSVLASGLILGLGLQLAYELWRGLSDPQNLKSWLFWQIKRPVTDRELKIVVGGYLAAWAVITWLFI